jgi:DNA invertase Pin-like site-specific DNA recombinase
MLDDFRQRGIKFKSPTEAIDTETPTGRAMWQMIGVLAELERSLITERTRAGVKAAQRRGVKFGRKAKLTPDRLATARKLIAHDDKTPTEAAKIMGVSRSTVYRALQRTADWDRLKSEEFAPDLRNEKAACFQRPDFGSSHGAAKTRSARVHRH